MRKILLNTLIMLAFTLSFFSKEASGEGFAYPGGDDKKANAQTSVYPPMPRPVFPLHPIEMTVATDKRIYNVGDTINFLVSVKNLRAKPFVIKPEELKHRPIPTINEHLPVPTDDVSIIYELYELVSFFLWPGPELGLSLELIMTGNVYSWETLIEGYSNKVIGRGAMPPDYYQPLFDYNRTQLVEPPPSPESFEPGEYILKVKLSRQNRRNESYEASAYLVIEPLLYTEYDYRSPIDSASADGTQSK